MASKAQIDALRRQLNGMKAPAASGGKSGIPGKSGGKPGIPKPPPPPPSIPGIPKPPSPPPGIPGVPKPPAPPPGIPGVPKPPAPPAPSGRPGLPRVPSIVAPPVPKLQRPAQGKPPQSGSDYPSGVYPGGRPKIQPGVLPINRALMPSYGNAGHSIPSPRYQRGYKQPAPVMQGPSPRAFSIPGMAGPRPGQTSANQGGYRQQRQGEFSTINPADSANPNWRPGFSQTVLEVDESGIELTQSDFAYAARLSGQAIAHAITTGDRKFLPNRMHWRTANQLPVPPGFESIEEFLGALGYQVDADGNWTKYNPVTNFGYGGGVYGDGGQGYEDYGGWGDGGGGYGGYARGFGRAPFGLVYWRIGL